MPRPEQPFRFLDSYEVEDADIFFGRERETRILLADILVSRLVVLFARTGTGKTSLINAGVRSRLEKQGYATFLVRVHEDPFESARAELRRFGKLEGQNLSQQLEAVTAKLKRPSVIIFDQFEEFFIYMYKKDRPKGREFIADIGRLYHNRNSRVHVLFSMREEFFVDMDAFRDEIPTIFHNECNLRLRGFDRTQARDAIVYPLRAFNTWIEAELVERLLTDFLGSTATGENEGQIEPAQLQIVCDTLWRGRKGDHLTLKDYLGLGRSGGDQNIARQVLFDRFEQSFAHIDMPEELELLARILPELRTPENTKFIREFRSLASLLKTTPQLLHELIEKLEGAHFVRTIKRENLELVELSHDYLVERLDALRDRVVAILPRRKLREVLDRFRGSVAYATADELNIIGPHIARLDLGREEAEILFRSALSVGYATAFWFQKLLERGGDVWSILWEQLKGETDREPGRALECVGELARQLRKGNDPAANFPPEAFGLVEYGLERDELTLYAQPVLADLACSRVPQVASKSRELLLAFLDRSLSDGRISSELVLVLGQIQSEESLALLERALQRDDLARQAQEGLVQMIDARIPDLASRARTVVIATFRAALARRTFAAHLMGALGEIATTESVILLREALQRDDLARSARAVLERLAQSPSAQVATSAGDALAGFIARGAKTSIGLAEAPRSPQVESQTPYGSRHMINEMASYVLAGKCVLFLGAGVHAPAPPSSPWNYPAAIAPPFGGDLSQKLADESGYLVDYPQGSPRELPRVAMHYELKVGKGRQALVNKVRAEVEVGKQPSPILRALAELNFPLIVITNYDSFFERSLPAAKQADIRIYQPNTDSHTADFGDLTGMTPGVCKIHGDFTRPESLVITDEDNIQFVLRMRDEDTIHPFPLTARFLMRKYPSLFVGYSLLDYNLRLFIKTLRLRLDAANFPTSYSVDPYPDKMVQTVWQDQRRWVWFVREGVWSFVSALYKAVTGHDMPA